MATRERTRRTDKHSNMLVRSLQYTQLHERKRKPLSVAQIAEMFDESQMTTYKLIRLGKAPKEVHRMIYKGEVTATEIVNEIRKSMSDKQIIAIASRLAQKRAQKERKLESAGFQGSSMTLRRKIGIALRNIQKKHLLGDGERDKMMKMLKDLIENPTVESIESSIVGT